MIASWTLHPVVSVSTPGAKIETLFKSWFNLTSVENNINEL